MGKEVLFIGNAPVRAGLSRALQQGRAHAFLLHGPKHVGKRTAAKLLAKEVLETEHLETHADFLFIGESEENITVETTRTVRKFLSTSPLVAGRKVVLLDGVERMTTAAGNALLKVLEEPPGHAVLFLLTSDIGSVLPTIRSRSLPARFLPVSDKEIAKDLSLDVGSASIRLAAGRPGLALRFLSDTESLAALERRVVAAEKLLVAERIVRLSYLARVSGQAPEAFAELPGQWLVALREHVRKGNTTALHLVRELFHALGMMQKTNVRAERLLETALTRLP